MKELILEGPIVIPSPNGRFRVKLQAGDDVARVEWVQRERLGDYQMTEGTREVIERAYSGAKRKLT